MWNDNEKLITQIEDNLFLDRKDYPVRCPVCGEKEGHLFYYDHYTSLNKGAKWIWCSSCQKCSHSYALIPVWWKNPNFIDPDKLASVPDYLEENKNSIDKWLNDLMISAKIKK